MVVSAHEELEQGLARVLNAASVTNLQRLSGGASRETWRFTADGEGYVLQRVRTGTVGGFQVEPKVLSAAHRAGVPVAELVVDGADRTELNSPFMIVRAVEGETIARKILRDDTFATARKVLTKQLGVAAAHLHQIDATSIRGLVPMIR